MEQKDEVVRKVGSKWQVQSKKGKNLGTFDTKKAADKHLREIHYFQHKGEAMEPTKKYDELISRAIDENGINTLEKAYAYLADKSSKENDDYLSDALHEVSKSYESPYSSEMPTREEPRDVIDEYLYFVFAKADEMRGECNDEEVQANLGKLEQRRVERINEGTEYTTFMQKYAEEDCNSKEKAGKDRVSVKTEAPVGFHEMPVINADIPQSTDLAPMPNEPKNTAMCPVCGSENMPMGVMGSRKHYRCANCGMDYSTGK